jgi:hypothetical protein
MLLYSDSRNRIVKIVLPNMEGMTPHNALESKPAAFGRSIFLNGFQGIL